MKSSYKVSDNLRTILCAFTFGNTNENLNFVCYQLLSKKDIRGKIKNKE